MIKQDYKLCRWPTEEGGCENDARYMITWEPLRVDDQDEEIMEEETIQEVNDAIANGVIFADRIPVCEKHRTPSEEEYRAMRFPEDATFDLITISQIVAYSVVRREQVTTIEVTGPDEYTEENVDVEENTDVPEKPEKSQQRHEEHDDPKAPYGYDDDGNPNAPYGYKKDGVTPMKKRGRKFAASAS